MTNVPSVWATKQAAAAAGVRACSACTGDYEDPDRTAWQPDDFEDAEEEKFRETATEKFPREE